MADSPDSGSTELVRDYRSNVFEVGFDASAFVLLFGWQEEEHEMNRQVRVTLAPEHAKLLHFLLVDALAEFEQRFGFIEY